MGEEPSKIVIGRVVDPESLLLIFASTTWGLNGHNSVFLKDDGIVSTLKAFLQTS